MKTVVFKKAQHFGRLPKGTKGEIIAKSRWYYDVKTCGLIISVKRSDCEVLVNDAEQ